MSRADGYAPTSVAAPSLRYPSAGAVGAPAPPEVLVEARDVSGRLALLGATACSATVPGAAAPTPAPTAGPAANPPPRPAFGAYLDAEMSFPDLATLSGQTGLKHVVLSFVLAKDGACEPAWGGAEPMTRSRARSSRSARPVAR